MADIEAKGFIHRVRDGQHYLVPADVSAEEWLAAIPVNKEILVSGRRPRYPLHHRWFFLLLSRIVQSAPGFEDATDLLDAIKLAVGHVKRQQKLSGEVVLLPRSIDFASMGEDEFIRFVARAKYVIAAALHIDIDALMKDVDRKKAA